MQRICGCRKMKRKANEQGSKHGKHRLMECGICGRKLNSNKMNKHLITHNSTEPCSVCGKEIRADKLPRHEILCSAGIDVETCNRHSGVSEILGGNEPCESVSGFLKSFELDIEVDSPDYDTVLKTVTEAAGVKLDYYRNQHPVKAQVLVTLSFYKQAMSGEREESAKVF